MQERVAVPVEDQGSTPKRAQTSRLKAGLALSQRPSSHKAL
jgi:hypothetical protein